ncbi:MAG: hypothetical protein TH68_00495 [Candidatus Synechococcus spongiarum 142]|uniref:Uncharacterized protein n=1 Tax=Candidatus Synechococcus spongiarum 142 TaxID=1608213 RepID=A0A6N3X6X8_9SYNE|nr:MAG: hypothetical protein TH68_00495 [Candidatus Synechococcus spongiarum 142]
MPSVPGRQKAGRPRLAKDVQHGDCLRHHRTWFPPRWHGGADPDATGRCPRRRRCKGADRPCGGASAPPAGVPQWDPDAPIGSAAREGGLRAGDQPLADDVQAGGSSLQQPAAHGDLPVPHTTPDPAVVPRHAASGIGREVSSTTANDPA